EIELAFVLKEDLRGPNVNIFDVLRATEYVTPALEVIDAHIEMEGRTIIDTISDKAALGAMVLGGSQVKHEDIDLRWDMAALRHWRYSTHTSRWKAAPSSILSRITQH